MKLADDLRRTVLQAAIEGNLTGGSREGWRFVRLKDVGITSTGTTPSTEHREYYNGDIPFIGPTDLNFYGTINYDTDKKLTHEGMQKSRCVNAGSILQVCIGTIGKVNVTEKLVCFNQQINAITPTLIDSYFLCYVLRSPDWQKQMQDNASQTTLPILNRRKWENLIIPLPPIDEQLRIVSRLNAILPLIAELETAENELEAL